MQDYLGTIAAVDENVGRLLNYLDDSNLSDNTVVVYTSDQGFYLGEKGFFDKRYMYEESYGRFRDIAVGSLQDQSMSAPGI